MLAETNIKSDGAFFVPKIEIISWINDILHVNLTKLEQLGTGAVYCQLLDAYHPGEVQLSKVSWKARLEHEFTYNFKTLQQAFDKLGIQRNIDVDKLTKAKYQDNLEFAQWMKGYLESKFGKNLPRDYDYLERRGRNEPDFSFLENKVPNKDALNYKNPIFHQDIAKFKAVRQADLAGMRSAKKHAMQGLNGTSPYFNNKENQGFEALQLVEKLKMEKEILMERLKKIEALVNLPDKTEKQVVKSIREFFAHQANVLSKRSLTEMRVDDDTILDLGVIDGEDMTKYSLVIDGESL